MVYDHFSRFYDPVMGDRSDAARYIAHLIAARRPGARTVLEIACGTGALLGPLSASYDVTGLDRSTPMLELARKKLPHTCFYRQDMTRFRVARRFDAIICVFDSINHLLRLTDWRKTFRSVARHLNHDGLFIFDVNTFGKLQRLAQGPAWERWFDRNLVIINVTAGRANHFFWHVRIFEHQKHGLYRLLYERIPEMAPPMTRIRSLLQRHFKKVRVLDPFGARPSDSSQRLYFVCENPGP